MKTRILSAVLFLVLSCGAAFAQDASSPVGTWELAIARTGNSAARETGTAFITFNADHTLTGYGLTTGSFTVFTLTGTWTNDAKGKLTGAYKQDDFGNLLDATFTGKATSGKRLEMKAEGILGRFKYSGVPMQGLPDISGPWNGAVTLISATSRTFETYQFTNSAQFPGVVDITGSGTNSNGAFTVSGSAIVTAKGKITAFKIDDFGGGGETSDTLVGRFQEKQQTIGFLGSNASGLEVVDERIHLSRP